MSPPRPHDDDDGATTIRTGPHSGLNSDFVTSSMYLGDSLPEGLRLGEYEILHVIGEGGFGIVYLAYDHFLQRQVALKEYMPSSLAGRSRMGLEVTIKSERHRDTFVAGLKSFINEARLLAQFDHRALVKVYRFWEGNGTAYMVMPYVVGPTLKAALAEMPVPPGEDWLRSQVLTPLMEALALLHKASCLHRDIAPDNILLTDTGPMLLDFGAARKVIGDLNQTLTVVLKPGYAPIEQYGEVPALTQGPWTDVYALGGVVRYAITGKVPVSATTRLVQDTMVPMVQLAAGRYSDAFLTAVDVALAVKPADRPQDMAQLAVLLGTPDTSVVGAMEAPITELEPSARGVASPQPRTVSPRPVTQPRSMESARTSVPLTQAPAAAQTAVPAQPDASAPLPSTGVAPTRRIGLVLGGLLLLALMGTAAWFTFRPAAPAVSSAAAAPEAPGVSEPISGPASVPVVTSAPPVAAPPAVPAEPAKATEAAAPRPAGPVKPPVSAAQPPRPSIPTDDRASRCSDLLQKASLEPLTPSETSFLKTECR